MISAKQPNQAASESMKNQCSSMAHLCICQLCTCGEHRCKGDNYRSTQLNSEEIQQQTNGGASRKQKNRFSSKKGAEDNTNHVSSSSSDEAVLNDDNNETGQSSNANKSGAGNSSRPKKLDNTVSKSLGQINLNDDKTNDENIDDDDKEEEESIDVDYEDDARSLSLPLHNDHGDNNDKRILVKSNKQDDTTLYYLMTKPPENSRDLSVNSTDHVVGRGEINLESTFDCNYDTLTKKRLATWTQDDTGTTEMIIGMKNKSNSNNNNNSNLETSSNNLDNLASNNDGCCYMTIYDKNLNRLEMVTGRKRSKHRPSTSLRPGYSGFFKPVVTSNQGETTTTKNDHDDNNNKQAIDVDEQQLDNNKQEKKDNDNLAATRSYRAKRGQAKKDFSPLFHNEYSNYDYECDLAIENDIKYKHQQRRNHHQHQQQLIGKLSSTNNNNNNIVDGDDRLDQSKLVNRRMSRPDCTCGSHYLLINQQQSPTNNSSGNNGLVTGNNDKSTQINDSIEDNIDADASVDRTTTLKKRQSRKKRKKKDKSSTGHQEGEHQRTNDLLEADAREHFEDSSKSQLTYGKHTTNPVVRDIVKVKVQGQKTYAMPAISSNINPSSRVLEMRNLKSSDPEFHLTFPGENRRLPLKRKIKNNPNLIDHIQQNNIINESHRQQKRHPIVNTSLTNSERTLEGKPKSALVVVANENSYEIKDIDDSDEHDDDGGDDSDDNSSYDNLEQQEQQVHNKGDKQSPARPSRHEVNIRRNTIRSDEFDQLIQKQQPQYRSKSTVANTRNSLQPQRSLTIQADKGISSNNDNNSGTILLSGTTNNNGNNSNRISKSRFISENRDATIETVAHSQKTRDKLHKTCQQQHFSIFDNDYPQPKDFDDSSSAEYKRWPSRNGHKDVASPKLTFLQPDNNHKETNGNAFMNTSQRIKSYNDLFRESPDSMFTFGDRCDYGTSYKSLCVGDNSQCPVIGLKDRFSYVGENLGHKFYAKK